jgi:lipocalin-like protein
MKRIKILAALFLFTAVLLTSCGDTEPLDPAINTSNDGGNGGGGGGGNTGTIVGTYRMTAFNTSVPTDLNGDSSPSTNQMSETSCFNNSMLTLNSNNTFSADSRGVEISGAGTLTCYTDPVISGTWVVAGNQLAVTYTDGGEQYTDFFTVSGNTLKATTNDGEVVASIGGTFEYVPSNIEIIYTKQ